jgi:hypothetical protein
MVTAAPSQNLSFDLEHMTINSDNSMNLANSRIGNGRDLESNTVKDTL